MENMHGKQQYNGSYELTMSGLNFAKSLIIGQKIKVGSNIKQITGIYLDENVFYFKCNNIESISYGIENINFN